MNRSDGEEVLFSPTSCEYVLKRANGKSSCIFQPAGELCLIFPFLIQMLSTVPLGYSARSRKEALRHCCTM
jgi:hypothetical protein